MKVIYKKTIVEQINDEIIKAKSIGKRIEKIMLTHEEMEQLNEETSALRLRGVQRFSLGITVSGVLVCLDNEEDLAEF